MALLNELKGEEHIKEENEYGDDGVIKLILGSNKTVARLQGRVSRLQKLCQIR